MLNQRYINGFLLGGLLLLASCSTSRIYIVRHAEKMNESDTSSLTVAGRERAQDLEERLADEQISFILTTPYRRTQQTAEPLSRQLNLPIDSYATVDAVVPQLLRLKGRNGLVVGHSNTILDTAKGLGTTPSKSRIESGDFDNLLLVTIRRGLFGKTVRLQEETYGQLTPP